MGKVFLYCDESGAKGYADNDETELGEVGVFAGILVPEEILATVKPAFDQIAKRYKPAEGKLHIADLPLEQKVMCKMWLDTTSRPWRGRCSVLCNIRLIF